MKIAIVAPASVPYVTGGAENLYQSLCQYFNNKISCSCEIITLPSPEGNFKEIINSYRKFSELNLDHFDLVISTKYPSWMVSHRNHVCYMLHPLRGLYDTYSLMGLPYSTDWDGNGLSELKNWMDAAQKSPMASNEDMGVFFQKLEQALMERKNSSLLGFPGPFVREVVHFLDTYALSCGRIKKYFAISSTVANRENYFPKGINVKTLYPEPVISDFRCKEFNYIFTASRLDSPKRIDLIINAFKIIPDDIPLIIAGDGPQRDELKKLASKDNRVKFVGRVSDEELLNYYANALAIVYVPYDEDYGYITIEAMKCSKPVITTIDSGGPNEFVEDGKNGFSVQPKPDDIAEKISFLSKNINVARKMGEHAKKVVNNISWNHVADKLLDENDSQNEKCRDKLLQKQKMVVVVTFSVYPPRGGGQARVFNLYSNLAKYYDIEIVCLCEPELPFLSRVIAPGLIETRVPLSSDYVSYNQNLSKAIGWIPVTDIAAIEGYNFLPDFMSALKIVGATADIIIASHPYLINAIREIESNASIWYESHNVEFDLKEQLLPNNEASKKLLKLVYDAEDYCWSHSEVVFACTEDDLIRLEELYGPSKAKKIVVPNGVDYSNAIFLNNKKRSLLKNKLDVGSKTTILFMGSWHGPNLEAAEIFIGLAADYPDMYFFLVGSAGLAFSDRTLPENIIIFGELDDEEKQVVMCASDVAINPMLSGSGSNLKMLDFFAYGIPVISTLFGARGIEAKSSIHFIETDIKSLSLELNSFIAFHHRYESMRINSRELVKAKFSWEIIADNFKDTLK